MAPKIIPAPPETPVDIASSAPLSADIASSALLSAEADRASESTSTNISEHDICGLPLAPTPTSLTTPGPSPEVMLALMCARWLVEPERDIIEGLNSPANGSTVDPGRSGEFSSASRSNGEGEGLYEVVPSTPSRARFRSRCVRGDSAPTSRISSIAIAAAVPAAALC
eukprot:CAMPEP_0179455000 /NCGR_PEP_ID=MMETSP0799-20121207/39004_1 /TAXON_ID=46947 /ORGANISM="Geminigera cryophila, Strain CCMP2564" /LENGTH=167 /DNA_ID=CAMNT_0021253721 /DNA_START=363 /DNA_END=866 /DNA_ORIENTATION=-